MGMIKVAFYVKKDWDYKTCFSLLYDGMTVMVTSGGLVRIIMDFTKFFGWILVRVACNDLGINAKKHIAFAMLETN